MAITNKLAHGTDYVELEGVADDDKPTENIGVNSKFYELDTGKEYYFDGDAWQEVGGA
jgi:hypothetical protein